MRTCHRCRCAMAEGFDIKVEGAGYGIKIAEKGIRGKRLEKPKVAVCPKCGEVSLYIEDTDQIGAADRG